MRVYEFSKRYGVSSKDLLSILSAEGFDVGSHMSILSQEAVDFLTSRFEGGAAGGPSRSVMPDGVESSQSDEGEVAEGGVFLEAMTVSGVADSFKKPVTEVILALLRWGIAATKNQLLSVEIVGRLANHFGVDVIKKVTKMQGRRIATDRSGNVVQERLPVVVVLGHVDHGKTTLLDFIRKTRVAAKEKGGITQHLGAYVAETPHGDIVFIDTPGHEAFSKIRARGISVADIAILVVAADDGVMPQTVEAIKEIKAMSSSVIVAVNKIDKVAKARLEDIKRGLAQYDLLPEEWGGHVVVAPISAKLGVGIDHLLEMIVLQAQLMELKTDFSGMAKGYVLEARLEKGRGPAALVLGQRGTIRIGDFFVCGAVCGKISSMVDFSGKAVREAAPSLPVQVAGFSGLPEAGDVFEVISKADYLRARSSLGKYRQLQVLPTLITEKALKFLIKTDTNSSKEALLEAIDKLAKKVDRPLTVIHSAVGGISESDIEMAKTTGATIVGLHVKVEPNATVLAQDYGVSIELFDIIYKLLEYLEAFAESTKEVKMIKVKTGEAVVRRVFDIKGLGVISGCYVKDGYVSKDGSVVIWRGQQKVGEGKIKSLQRERKTVKEVHAGYECGFIIENHTDWMEEDRVECFIEAPEKKK